MVPIPASKSHSLRAALFATIADGTSTITAPLDSPDARACLKACEQLGAKVEDKTTEWIITGTGGNLTTPNNIIDVGNSGITLRFITGLAACCNGEVVITGDHSIQTNRPMDHMITMINELGGVAVSTTGTKYAPLSIKGPIKGGKTTFNGEDSQPVSGTLLASLLCEKPVEIFVENAGETPWMDLSLAWFDRFKLQYTNDNYNHYTLPGKQAIKAFNLRVPGDFSSAAFPIAAGLLVPDSTVTIEGLDMNDPQGDKKIIPILQEMGGALTIGEELHVTTSTLQGQTIDVNELIDAVPILAVIGTAAEGTTILKNAGIARKKESDRLAVMTKELKKMGAQIEETADTLTIHKSTLTGATVDSHNDHRVALSLAVAGMIAEGTTTITNAEYISKTFGTFPSLMNAVGAHIEVQE